MRRKQVVTLPQLIEAVGAAAIVEATGCDRTLPKKWAKGQRPGWKNAEKLVEFAKAIDAGHVHHVSSRPKASHWKSLGVRDDNRSSTNNRGRTQGGMAG